MRQHQRLQLISCAMTRLFKILFLVLAAPFVLSQAPTQTPSKALASAPATDQFFDIEWNALMMQSTYQILGSDGKGGRLSGTAFVLARSNSTAAAGIPFHGLPTDTNSLPLLITAAHVMNGIVGETAILKMHFKDETETWQEIQIPIHIRKGIRPLWTQHPVGDVAILQMTEQRAINHLTEPLLSTDSLATDNWIKDFQLHPGDEVVCLGFPEEVESAYGFPILRIGRIASYPIVPTLSTRPLYIDFPVYGGNSGGPAYITISGSRGKVLALNNQHPPEIIGLVVQKRYERPSDHDAVSAVQASADPQRLADMHLAVLEPSTVILETIAMLSKP
jgi:hypothetical protein